MPGTDTIDIYRGEDVLLPFVIEDEDISGWTLLLSVNYRDEIIITKDGTITDAAGGSFTFLVDAGDTVELEARAYRYDVWRTDVGSERLLAIGAFTVAERAREVTT
jgi:hypothetical protein